MHSINEHFAKYHIRYLAGIILFMSIIHFALPMTITFDTSHYHTYLPIIDGKVGMDSWDVVRGPVFPYFLSAVHYIFGYSHGGVLTGSWFLYLTLVICAYYLAYKLIGRVSPLIPVLFIFLVGMDPTIVGYYHALLTEFVAATIFMVVLALVVWWIDVRPGCNLSFLISSMLLILLVPTAYHLKQPYVSIAIFPLFGAFLCKLISNEAIREKMLRLATVLVALVALALSIHVWNRTVPKEAFYKYKGRSSSSLLYQQIKDGIKPFKRAGFVSNYTTEQLASFRFSSSEKKLLGSLSGKETKCSQIWVGDQKDLIAPCNTSESIFGIFHFVWKVFLAEPTETISGYWNSYSQISTLKQPRFQENRVIAERVFHDTNTIGNAFWVSDHLRGHITPYAQHPAATIGLAGKLPFKWFIGQSRWLFMAVVVISPFVSILLLSVLLINRSRHLLTPNFVLLTSAIFVINFVVSLHVAAHAFLDALIDRYAAPIFPVAYLGFLLTIVLVVHFFIRQVPKQYLKKSSI